MDGANDSTTVPDESSFVHTITCNSTAKLSTAQQRFGTASGVFSGSDHMSVDHHASLDPGGSEFSIEFFCRLNNTTSSMVLINKAVGTGFYPYQIWYSNSTSKFGARGFNQSNASVYDMTGTTSPTTNTWYHIALTRAVDTMRLFVNGNLEASTTFGSGTLLHTNASAPFTMGNYSTNNAGLNGYMDEVRFLKGQPTYTSSFTAPSAPFTIYS